LELSQLRDFAKRYTAEWCSQNAASVAAFFEPNGSLSVNGAPAVGRAAITEVAQGFMTAFPDMQLLMDDILIQGDRAAYHWTFIGTNTGPGGAGHRVRFGGFEEWKFAADGLIAASQSHFAAADYLRQLARGAS
jgi:predicted ester cyclase